MALDNFLIPENKKTQPHSDRQTNKQKTDTKNSTGMNEEAPEIFGRNSYILI
ncbi:hypothetical protein DERP_010114, partial [Dermatophagoides pteronyssinus]